MLIYKDNYGEDIDGNRGMEVWEYGLEDSDYEEVREGILNYLWDNGLTWEEAPKTLEVPMYDYVNDEVIYLEVTTSKYKEER